MIIIVVPIACRSGTPNTTISAIWIYAADPMPNAPERTPQTKPIGNPQR